VSGIDTGRIERAVAEILAAIGEDPVRPGLVDTPRRVAESAREYFAGLGVDAIAWMSDPMPAGAAGGELVIIRDLDFRSVCEHHLVPFTGVAHVAYVPDELIIGLGAVPRVIDTLASRPQLQERLAQEIADAFQTGLDPRGVLVVLDASHLCLSARGPRQQRSSTVTIAARGALADPVARAEAVALLARGVDE
jgi:GTP cyclohydrolase I